MLTRAGVASNVGLVRQTNEDSYLLRRGLYAVCDGMGGARAGEIASEMACRGLTEVDPAAVDGAGLVAAVKDINRTIADRSLEEPALFGMGTTLTAAAVEGTRLLLVHVGDSRAYLLHEGDLRQISEDHSWVGEMIRRGELSPAEAAVHPHRSVITRALGTDSEVEPDLIEAEVSAGDRLLLCSDGLTGMVSEVVIEQELRASEEPSEVARRLVRAALSAGGDDNVTVIVVEFQVEDTAEVASATPGVADDEILLGPSDRGGVSAASASTGGHLRNVRAAARGRLGGRLGGSGPRSGGREEGDPAAIGEVTLGHASAETGVAATEPATSEAVGPEGAAASEAAPPEEAVASLGQAPASSVASAGTHSKGSRRRRWLIAAVVVVVILVAAIGGFSVFNSAVYYLGVHEGTVALYNGLPANILGLELSSVVEQGKVAYDGLPSYIQARIDAHELTSKEEGQRYLRSLGATQ